MKSIAAAALAGIAMASTPSLAADLFGTAPPPMSFPAENGPAVEVGSNWYLRGDIGLSLDPAATFSLASVSTPGPGVGILPFTSSVGSSSDREDFAADIGVGYRFNNWLRFEGTYEYRTGPAGSNANSVICPTTLVASPAGSPTPTGYLYDTTSTCTGSLSLRQRNSTALASAYLDLGNYWGVTPYVGAGGGLNANMIDGNVAYAVDATGTPYSANLSAPSGAGTTPKVWVDSIGTPLPTQPNIGFTNQVWNHSIKTTKYSMAWALMAGVGIQLSPSATLDIGYRYLNAGTTSIPITTQTGATVRQPNVSQDIRVGIRYMAD